MEHPTPNVARRRRLFAFTTISAVVALLAAIASICRVSLLPPNVTMRELQTGAAVTHILVDLPRDERSHVSFNDFSTMTKRSNLIGHMLASPPVLVRIASRMEIDTGALTAATEITEGVPLALTEPNNERRANEILLLPRSLPPRHPGGADAAPPRRLRAGADRGEGASTCRYHRQGR